MGKHAQLVMGPAGCGKSTFCEVMYKHCENTKRSMHVVNLDPAAEVFNYPVSIDLRELITVDEVMEELAYGPNGGLVYAMEYLIDHIDWLLDEIGDYEDDYLIIDCPGQIELYSHVPIMRTLAEALQQAGYRVCGLYLLDSQFITDASKFISGALSCLSAMVRLELPHINVLTKVDLLSKKQRKTRNLEKYLELDVPSLVSSLDMETDQRMHKLNEAIGTLLDDYSMVSFVPLDITDPDSISLVMQHIDNATQYGEDVEVNDPRDAEQDIDLQ
jgi:GTPase SAR1 family protein